MTEAPVSVHAEGGVMTITLNRPESRNAINGAVATGLAAAIDELDARPDLRIAILTGAGGFFSAGADLKALSRGESVSVEGRGFAGITSRPPRKPMIGAVEGLAIAGGFEIALVCDLLVVAAGARFGLMEVKRGLLAGGGGLLRLPRQLPYRIAMELVLTGDLMTTEQLAPHGLFNRIVPAGSALDEAMALARTICANAPLSVASTKEVVVASADWPSHEMFDRQQAYVDRVMASADAHEGPLAFVEKRVPVWTGQ